MILDKFKLDGKTALVTGASVGLGRAMAIALAEAGADVACHCHFDGEANETCDVIEKLGRKTVSMAGDMSQRDIPQQIIESVIENFGKIDILINNAGMIRRSPIGRPFWK
jgi:2-deoxy-D-gluconate 3-dehydrogenase